MRMCFLFQRWNLKINFTGRNCLHRLAWLVHQDEENYRLQLEEAVSLSHLLFYFIFFFSGTFSGTCLFCEKSNIPRNVPYLFYFSLQGFSSQNYSATDASCVILACELRTGLNFSLEDIAGGKLKEHLLPEDYDLDKRVSTY